MKLIYSKKIAVNNIKKRGYYVFKSVFTKKYIEKLHNLIKNQKSYGQSGFFNNSKLDSKAVLNLQSKHLEFIKLLQNKIICTINKKLLNDKYYKSLNSKLPNYTLCQYAARSAGKSKLVLHIDDKVPSNSENINYLQWAIPMIDLTKKNGCTQVLPGSHKYGMLKPALKKKHKLKDLTLKAGDMVVWDGRIWHSARPNIKALDRWAVIITFSKWFFKPHYDIPRSFPKNFYKYLTKELKIILGFASIPKFSEKSGIIQRGDLTSANKFLKNRIY